MSARQHDEFEAWLSADEGNRIAFAEMRVLWVQLGDPVCRLAKKRRKFWPVMRFPFLRPGHAVAAFAAIAVTICGIWIANPRILQNWRADIVAGSDTASQFGLLDGSSVMLAANSAITTDFDGGDRFVKLLRGQAFFNVVARHGDPFTVKSGDAFVRVVGTRFNVDRLGSETVVTVEKGRVQVTGGQNSDAVEIGPGQQVSVTGGRLAAPHDANSALAMSWLKGRLSVERMTVADLAEQFARYQDGRILVLGDVADRRVSGTFPTGNVFSSLQTVADAVGARVVQASPWLTLLY